MVIMTDDKAMMYSSQMLHRTCRPISHHIKNMKDFVQKVKSIKLEEGECMTSYDVKALFKSMPVDPTINIIRNRLE